MRWKNPYVFANDMSLSILRPVPHAIMGSLYSSADMQAMAVSPYWTEEFVGLGPYRLKEWQRGTFIDVVANDQYFLGRPKIDRINLRYFGDVNTLVVTLISGEVDMVPVGSFKEEEAAAIKRDWESAGLGQVIVSANKLRDGEWQWRDPTRPWVQDARVRQALVQMIDRQGLVDSLRNGVSEVDDIMMPRSHPAYQMARKLGLPNLGYDPTAAQRALEQAGLIRGTDGVYRTYNGDAFNLDVSTTTDIKTNVQELLAISDAWKSAGLQPTPVFIGGTANKDEMRSLNKGVNMTSTALDYTYVNILLTKNISSEGTKWKGSNLGGYTDADFDQLADRMLSTFPQVERDELAANVIKQTLDKVLYIPLFYSADFTAVGRSLRGVTGVVPAQRVNAWNVETWEMPQ
jgi:ABC-type transport system substrate-binding protein